MEKGEGTCGRRVRETEIEEAWEVRVFAGTEDDCRRCEYLLRRTDGQTDGQTAAYGKVNTHNQIIIIILF